MSGGCHAFRIRDMSLLRAPVFISFQGKFKIIVLAVNLNDSRACADTKRPYHSCRCTHNDSIFCTPRTLAYQESRAVQCSWMRKWFSASFSRDNGQLVQDAVCLSAGVEPPIWRSTCSSGLHLRAAVGCRSDLGWIGAVLVRKRTWI